jgi:HEPN domain-containing protein
LLDPVVKYFNPQSVILFGSRARGEATRDSDIDLLVIVDDDTPSERLTWKAGFDSHPSFTGAADVFPMRVETFERDRGITGTLAAEADTDGIVVYGSPKGSASMRPGDPRARWEAVERWLAVAEVDRNTAATCIATGGVLYGSAAFHCQQAIEKLLKGFLVLAGKRFRKTHSLAQLGGAAQQSFPDLENLVKAARNWSDWAFEYRYPSASGPAKPLPEEDELRRALATVDILAARLRAARPGD